MYKLWNSFSKLSHFDICIVTMFINSYKRCIYRYQRFCGEIYKYNTHHNSILLLAGVLSFVHVVITITFVILRYRATLELAKPRERSRLDQHLLEADRFVLRTVKHIRGILVEDDALAHYVAALHRDEKRLKI